MIVRKTIKYKIICLTNVKEAILEKEYGSLQEFLQLKDVLWWKKDLGENLYSTNKQQVERFYKAVHLGKEYPLSIRKDLIQIEKRNTKLTKYWLRIRVKGRRSL